MRDATIRATPTRPNQYNVFQDGQENVILCTSSWKFYGTNITILFLPILTYWFLYQSSILARSIMIHKLDDNFHFYQSSIINNVNNITQVRWQLSLLCLINSCYHIVQVKWIILKYPNYILVHLNYSLIFLLTQMIVSFFFSW